MIYFDNASTTPVKQEVINAMMPYFSEKWFNPSSLYNVANDIKNDVNNAKLTVANKIHANQDEVFFTSGGSESNCWAIQGFINQHKYNNKKVAVITSVIEHNSILSCVRNLNMSNIVENVYFVGVDQDGFVKIPELKNWLFHAKIVCEYETIVSIQFANNEIGTIQHIKEIADLVHRYGCVFHTDAVQAFGYIPIDVNELGIDMMSVSGHKIGAPKGIGFLYKRSDVKISPLIYGTQMNSMRGGTENVPYIIGLAKAIDLMDYSDYQKFRFDVLRTNFIVQLKSLGCYLNGSETNRIPNNINVILPDNLVAENVIYMLDMSLIYVSAGSACDSHSMNPSRVLKAIGLSDEEAAKTIRITISENTSMDEIDCFISELKKIIKILED